MYLIPVGQFLMDVPMSYVSNSVTSITLHRVRFDVWEKSTQTVREQRTPLGLRGHKQALCQLAKHAYIWAGARARERAFKRATTTVPTANIAQDPGRGWPYILVLECHEWEILEGDRKKSDYVGQISIYSPILMRVGNHGPPSAMGACSLALNWDLEPHSVYKVSKQWQYQGPKNLNLEIENCCIHSKSVIFIQPKIGLQSRVNSMKISYQFSSLKLLQCIRKMIK